MQASTVNVQMKTLMLAFVFFLALSQVVMAQAPGAPAAAASRSGLSLYVKVQLDKSVKLSCLKPGDVTEGSLARDVYSADRKVFAAGSHIRLTVDHLERKRRTASNRWPWVVKVFLPRHETLPSFKNAAISLSDGSESRLQVSVISAGFRTDVQHRAPHHKRDKRASEAATMTSDIAGSSYIPPVPDRSPAYLGPVMSLDAHEEQNEPDGGNPDAASASTGSLVTLPAGTACRILLLKGVSASKSHPGDPIQARLLDPVVLDSHVVLPAGSLFEGSVIKAIPPRWLSRAGSLSMAFTGMTLPDSSRFPVSASLTGVEVNRGSHTKMDAEGGLHGDRPGAAWMLINGGFTAGIAKEVDDGTQLIIEAILSTATDASTAGTARIAGTIVSSILLVTRHGRDVILPNSTEMNITLNRPLTLSGSQPSASAIGERESGAVMPPASQSHEQMCVDRYACLF